MAQFTNQPISARNRFIFQIRSFSLFSSADKERRGFFVLSILYSFFLQCWDYNGNNQLYCFIVLSLADGIFMFIFTVILLIQHKYTKIRDEV